MTSRSPAQREEMLDALRARKLSKKETKQAEALAALWEGVKPAADTTELLIHRFLRALERDRAGTSIPDGYPRGSGFEGRGGGGHKVDADLWEGESTIALTSVELAIEQRLYAQKTVKDHHRDLTHQFEAALARAADDIAEAKGLADRLDNLVDMSSLDNAPCCTSCARYKDDSGRAHHSEVYRGGLCQWCYIFVNDEEKNPTGRLPVVELIERRARGQYITVALVEQLMRAQADEKKGRKAG